ncbi:alpha/beta hydrolase [Nocardioides sp.]|uniref:alpha/beta fold hydrolase n=1 Tax=Nocardioides sp. TaxID=35761 RepID=UPI0019CD8472|nr:alpha/beta hydrolase [Nocardioides sp.]MBC7275796.1 lysophospholipase [Nocardioides sp.]
MPTTATFVSPTDGTALAIRTWGEELSAPRGVVQIAHGIAEHGQRYDRLARALVEAGYVVRAVDHRGHGGSVASADQLGHFDFEALVADVAAMGASLRDDFPGVPVFLVAHSMGSFAAQTVLLDRSDLYDGVVLSGSTALDVLAGALSSAEGPVGLEAFNAGFEHRTGYEWLSRDEAEVDAYVADPLSGFDLPDTAVPQLFAGAERLADPAAIGGIRSDLPILVVSGDADPLAGGGALIELLGERYREAGLKDVTVTLYPEARHEIFNETNRDEITADVIDWLRARS